MDGRIQSSVNMLVTNVTEVTHDFKEFQRRMICIIGEVLLAMVLLFVNPLTPSMPKSTLIISLIVSIVTMGIIISLSIVSSKEMQSYHEMKDSFISKYHDEEGNPIYTMNVEEYLIDIEEFSNATERFIRIHKIVNMANLITALIAIIMLFVTIGSVITL